LCVSVIVPQAIEYLRRLVTLYRDRVRRFFKVRTYLLWKAILTVLLTRHHGPVETRGVGSANVDGETE